MIEMVLHVDYVVFDNEPQCLYSPADDASIPHVFFGDPLDEVRDKGVVAVPEIHECAPFHFVVTVRVDPFLLCVTEATEFSVHSCQNEADVIIRSRVDEMPEFLLSRPATGAAVIPAGFVVRNSEQVRKLSLDG